MKITERELFESEIEEKDEYGHTLKYECVRVNKNILEKSLKDNLDGSIVYYVSKNIGVSESQFTRIVKEVIKKIENENDDDYTSWRFVNELPLISGYDNKIYASLISFRIRDSY